MKAVSKTLHRDEHKIDPEFAAAVNEGLADAKAGRVTPYEQVRRWLLSWGSDKELPPPECK
jgi:predicted transcriptional regulator